MLEQGGRAHRAEHEAASESPCRRAKATPLATGERVALSRCAATSCYAAVAVTTIARNTADKTDSWR